MLESNGRQLRLRAGQAKRSTHQSLFSYLEKSMLENKQNSSGRVNEIRTQLKAADAADLLKAFNALLKEKPNMNPDQALEMARAEISEGDDGSAARVFRQPREYKSRPGHDKTHS